MPKVKQFNDIRPVRTRSRRAPRGNSFRDSATPPPFARNSATGSISRSRRKMLRPRMHTGHMDTTVCATAVSRAGSNSLAGRGFVAGQGMNVVVGSRCGVPAAPSGFPNRRCEIQFFTRTSAAPKNGPRPWAPAWRNRRSPTRRSLDLPGAGFGRDRDGRRLRGRRMRT